MLRRWFVFSPRLVIDTWDTIYYYYYYERKVRTTPLLFRGRSKVQRWGWELDINFLSNHNNENGMGSSSTSQKLNFTKVENEIKSLKHFLCRYGLGKGEQWQDQGAKQVGSANCIRYDLTEEVMQNRKRCVNSLKSNIWAEHIPTSFSFYFFDEH